MLLLARQGSAKKDRVHSGLWRNLYIPGDNALSSTIANSHQEPVPGQAWLLYLFFPLEDSYVKGKTYTRRSGMGKKEERKACIASLVPT